MGKSFLKRFMGFTLAELLIALAILAVIATFTIPKVLSSQADQKKKALFKETLSAISDITNQAARQGGLASWADERAFFSSRLNYVKICQTDPTGEGCWSNDASGSTFNADAYVLQSGVMISSVNYGAGTDRETIAIDWNGLAGPNVHGDDILDVIACFGPSSCGGGGAPIVLGAAAPGAVGPQTGNQGLYTWIYAN